MINKISNNAARTTIEKEFGRMYKFPNHFRPKITIDGHKEATISIITMDDPETISFGTWGLLPSEYQKEWVGFQEVINTLNISVELAQSHLIFKDAFQNRRCLIIVTGFFVHRLEDGHLNAFFVHDEKGKVFSLAGVYNVVSDGFITCSIITSDQSGIVERIQNLESNMPVIIEPKNRNFWIDQTASIPELTDLLTTTKVVLKASKITEAFFLNEAIFSSFLKSLRIENPISLD